MINVENRNITLFITIYINTAAHTNWSQEIAKPHIQHWSVVAASLTLINQFTLELNIAAFSSFLMIYLIN